MLEIVRTLAGYSLGKADSMRRVISKKKPTKWLLNVKTLFTAVTTEIYRLYQNGIDEQTAISIFDEINDFANYASTNHTRRHMHL